MANDLADLQRNGANRSPTFWRCGSTTFVGNRFDVTTDVCDDGEFPLQDERYVVQFNGEVFGFREQAFPYQRYPSDVHYCLDLINEYGVDGFLRGADIQGSFQIYDKLSDVAYFAADQVNSCGAFYAQHNDTLIVAQEAALVHWTLERIGAPPDVAVEILRNGCLLKIQRDGSVALQEYRPDARQVYSGRKLTCAGFDSLASALTSELVEATIRRLPSTGPVVVLAGGGVDSSLILAIVVKHLRTTRDLDRLRIVTFGAPDIGLPDEENDLVNSVRLIEALGLSSDKYLLQIPEDLQARASAFLSYVFCDNPRLITPNPILNTQVRHTVRMSMVLAALVRDCPGAKVVLTGDVADELFCGYHSMRVGVETADQLAERIREKLSDLPLNDSSRYTLASLFGCSALLKTFAADNDSAGMKGLSFRESTGAVAHSGSSKQSSEIPGSGSGHGSIHPVEIRTPFSSHRVLRLMRDAHPDVLVGSFGGKVMAKFLLRVVARRYGLPIEIAGRKKIPFNEGGSGVRNADRDRFEDAVARNWIRYNEKTLLDLAQNDRVALKQLSIVLPQEQFDAGMVQRRYEQIALYAAAKRCGLDRLIRGGVFRDRMPDCVYSTDEKPDAYQPGTMFWYGHDDDKVELRDYLT